MSFALWVARSFRLTPAVSARVKHFLDVMHEGKEDALLEAERNEKAALLEEFFS